LLVHRKAKYRNAALILETIPELAGYFTRVEDLDRKREKTHTSLTKAQTRRIKMKRIE
jgi:hypothetical protein